MNALRLVFAKYSFLDQFFKIFSYPFFSLFTNPIILLKSMKNIITKVVFKRQIRMFSEERAINNYWYDTMSINLYKHGRLGYSKTTLDNEKYLVGKWFHISKYSLYPYWKSSVISVLLSWILIPLVFYFLFPSTSSNWFFSVTFLTIIGSAYFSQLEGQNYNILGWVFFPFLFWSIENNYVLELAVIISFLFLTSFTAYFVSFGYLATAFITDMLTIHEILFAQLFSIPLVIYRFYPLYKKGHLKSHFITIGNTIGLFKNSEAKYSRNIRNNKALLFGILRSLIFLTFILYLNTNSSPYYLWLVLGYQIVNSFLARFADVETIDMLIILTSFYYMLKSESLIELSLYWCLISNPIPKLHFINDNKSIFKLKTLNPFNAKKLNDRLISFVSKINSNRVFISFQDPLNDYDKIFYGQRSLIEPLHFHATRQDVLLLPNLWSITNETKSDPNMWGRDAKKIIEIMTKRDFNYMIYYTISDENIPEDIIKNFSICDSFQWKTFLPQMFSNKQNISWHLLKMKV